MLINNNSKSYFWKFIDKEMEFIKLRLINKTTKPPMDVNISLGQKKINIQNFLKRFNCLATNINYSQPLCIKILIYKSRDYEILIHAPSITCLTKTFLLLNNNISKSIDRKSFFTILKIKKNDINTLSTKSAIKQLLGSFKSMSISIK